MDLTTTARSEAGDDVGTLWTMHRPGHRARCALIARVGEWELRVLVDGVLMLTERCECAADSFSLADAWKHRMLEDGWRQVVPKGW